MKKKVYISGPDARMNIGDADMMLEGNFEPVFPADQSLAWNDRIVANIQLLISCDAIFMVEGWMSMQQSRIEFKIAEETGLDVYFQSYQERERFVGVKNDRFAGMVKAAIREVMGRDFDNMDNSKSRDIFFMRMIFTYHCRGIGMQLKQIKTYIHRDHTTMLHYLKRYRDEYRYNAEFRDIADRVSNILSTFVSV